MSITKTQKGKLDSLWGKIIHTRDKVCQRCGRSNTKLDAHHIFYKRFMATRWDPQNGILLCFNPCHKFGENSAHQDIKGFRKWVKTKIGEVNFQILEVKKKNIVRFPDYEINRLYLEQELKKVEAR